MRKLNDAREGAQPTTVGRLAGGWEQRLEGLFDGIPYGLFKVNASGSVLALNVAARALLLGDQAGPSRSPLRCCQLICDHLPRQRGEAERCLTREARAVKGALPELRVELPADDGPVVTLVTVSALGEDGDALFHLRSEPAAPSRETATLIHPHARLRVFSLGPTRIESTVTGSIGGQWVEQRPGQLFKYLVCARQQLADVDEIALALWPDAADTRARASVRYFVHTLRARLEPTREPGTASAFITSRSGGYGINTARVWIDATEFEQAVATGLAALAAGEPETALARLERAMDLYRGHFLADEPYAEWALVERDRLRELAGRALGALTELRLSSDDIELAARHARRLADMEPHDSDAQRRHIEISLRRGRRSEALRRYQLFRKRLARDFDQDPDFELSDLQLDERPGAET